MAGCCVLVAATTSLVLVAFLVPLALLVRHGRRRPRRARGHRGRPGARPRWSPSRDPPAAPWRVAQAARRRRPRSACSSPDGTRARRAGGARPRPCELAARHGAALHRDRRRRPGDRLSRCAPGRAHRCDPHLRPRRRARRGRRPGPGCVLAGARGRLWSARAAGRGPARPQPGAAPIACAGRVATGWPAATSTARRRPGRAGRGRTVAAALNTLAGRISDLLRAGAGDGRRPVAPAAHPAHRAAARRRGAAATPRRRPGSARAWTRVRARGHRGDRAPRRRRATDARPAATPPRWSPTGSRSGRCWPRTPTATSVPTYAAGPLPVAVAADRPAAALSTRCSATSSRTRRTAPPFAVALGAAAGRRRRCWSPTPVPGCRRGRRPAPRRERRRLHRPGPGHRPPHRRAGRRRPHAGPLGARWAGRDGRPGPAVLTSPPRPGAGLVARCRAVGVLSRALGPGSAGTACPARTWIPTDNDSERTSR